MSDDMRGSLTELCWACEQPLDKDDTVRLENEWPVRGAHFYHAACSDKIMQGTTISDRTTDE